MKMNGTRLLPSVTGKELHPLNQLQLAGFRLHPGPLPEEYRGLAMVHSRQRRHKAKKHKYRWDISLSLSLSLSLV